MKDAEVQLTKTDKLQKQLSTELEACVAKLNKLQSAPKNDETM
jgi:hypothetical protein